MVPLKALALSGFQSLWFCIRTIHEYVNVRISSDSLHLCYRGGSFVRDERSESADLARGKISDQDLCSPSCFAGLEVATPISEVFGD